MEGVLIFPEAARIYTVSVLMLEAETAFKAMEFYFILKRLFAREECYSWLFEI